MRRRTRIPVWLAPAGRATPSLSLLLCLALMSSAAQSDTITVVGQDNKATDRSSIQAAIDRAAPGDTVELVGVFQLDGTRVFITKAPLTLAGRALDNDNDGAVNEDWADGADNDGDGRVDEDDWDTVVRGVANPDGSPAGDSDPSRLFNRGFVLEGAAGTFRRVEVRNIKFQTHHRAISLQPDWKSPTLFCDDIVSTGGSSDGISVLGNWFDNCRRGVQAFGEVARLTIKDNQFTLTTPPSILGAPLGVELLGGLTVCFLPGGGTRPLRVGTPRMTEVANNRFIAGGTLGILTSGTSLTTIRHNTFAEMFVGISLFDDEKASVHSNEVLRTVAGIAARDAAPGATVSNNRLNRHTVGLFFDSGASGLTALNNRFEASSVSNVFFTPASFENTVIATDFETTVVDLGRDNRLLGTLAMIHNPGLPDEVRRKLEELRQGLAQKTP